MNVRASKPADRAAKKNSSKRRPAKGDAATSGSFPIVAIGASAGGLEAYQELFRALPNDTGMGFVLIQHLDPTHHSMLTEIIGKTTKMPVEEVRAGVAIQPNHVYVIPPNALIAIDNCVFQLSPRGRTPGQHLAVNHFMRSLAQEQQSRAIGIVLSGTGADGTAGMEDIKAEGGITFAQDPSTAKYDGMPRSAIDSGCVDFILAPKDIASELRRIQNHPYVRVVPGAEAPSIPAPPGGKPDKRDKKASVVLGQLDRANELTDSVAPASHEKDFTAVLSQLRRVSGVDFSQYKPNTIHRRSLRRMMILKLDSMGEYAQYLKENPEEARKLYDDVLIPVTSFFRDFEAFEALKAQVFPAIVKDKANKGTIRMWAPGCSTGEETYSLAMTLLEFLGERASSFQIQIFGTDLNEKGIQKARAGVYRESIAEEISPELMERFFVKVDEGYRVNKAVRDLCVFARQNLVSDPPFSQMNVVACRNLLIYIQPVLQKKIVPILHYALKPSGFLILGGSESVSAFPDLFSVVEKKHRIYAKKSVASRLHYDFAQSYYPAQRTLDAPGGTRPSQPAAQSEQEIQAEADRLVLTHHAPVGVVVNNDMEVVQFRGRTAPFLESAPGKPSLNVLKLARNGLAIELRTLIAAAAEKGAAARKDGIPFDGNGHRRMLNLSVMPLGEKDGRRVGRGEGRFFLILFDDVTPQGTPPDGSASTRKTKAAAADGQELKRLKQELLHAQDALRLAVESEDSLKEEFQSANEEILSANEELQSTNEELETSKEELQSANEELNTLNSELRNKNAELQELTNDISNLLNSTRIPVVMLDLVLSIRRITPAATRLFRVQSSDIGRPLADIKLNIDSVDLTAADLDAMMRKTLDTLQPVERDVRDLKGRWHSLGIQPYRTQENKIDGVVLALQDIDAMKAAGEQLRKSAEFFRGILDTVGEPLLALDADLRVTMANRAFLDTFHVSPEETLQRLLYDLGNGQWDIPELRRVLERVLPEQEVVTNFQVQHDFETIGPGTMVLSARRLEQVNPQQPMILLAIEDITAQTRLEENSHQLQEDLDRQRRIYDKTLSSISDFAYVFDREGRFIYVNKPLLDLWGMKLEDAMGKTFFELPYSKELAEKLHRQILQVFETGKPVSDETSYTNPRGETGWYAYIFNPVFDAGKVELVAGSTHDLTERRRSEAALIKSEKLAASGRLAAALAHEINNPLQAVTNLLALIGKSPRLDEQDRNWTKLASEELEQVANLTRQSLSFYRENRSPKTGEVVLNEVLDSVVKIYERRIEQKKITLSKRYSPQAAAIQSYSGDIRQAFATLLLNAIDAVPEGGSIDVRAHKAVRGKTEGVQILVADNGPGIPPVDKAHIFEPFFTTKGDQGTGLGLWVAQAIVQRLGGTLQVRNSIHPGKTGACFTIFLPNRLPEPR